MLKRSCLRYLARFSLVFCLLVTAAAEPEPGEPLDLSKLNAIVLGEQATPLEKRAASELKAYLLKIYGLKLEVQERSNIEPGSEPVIFLGEKAAIASGIISADELAGVRWDGYVVRSRGNSIAVAGPRARATLFGVVGLLERLGCRFYGTHEILPARERVIIEQFSFSDKPAMEFRRVNNASWTLKVSGEDLGDPREAENSELFTSEAGSDLWIDHTAGYLVPPELYFEEHPEYFALVDGKRIISTRNSPHHRVVLCLSNQDVARISAERLLKWIEQQSERRFFAVTYGDTDVQCECESCRALDPAPGRHQDRLLHWVNAVAREVAKSHPDKVLLSFAYGNTRWVPEREVPEFNVIVLYAPFFGISTLNRTQPYFLGASSQPAAAEMEDWFKRFPRNLGIYDYSIGNEILTPAYEKKFKFWGKRGFRGFWECSRPEKFRGLEIFIKSALAWDPTLDPKALEREYYDSLYGPAGADVSVFVDCVFKMFGDDRDDSFPGESQCAQLALTHLEQAKAAVVGTEYEKKLFSDSDINQWVPALEKKLAPPPEPKAPAPTPVPPPTSLQLSKSTRISRSGFKLDSELTELKSIHLLGDSKAVFQAAVKLQEYLEEHYRIKLPIEQDTVEIDENTKGVILIGRQAALASALVDESDFQAAGPDGIVARGRDGRIAIAAARDENSASAVAGFIFVDSARRTAHGGWRMRTFGLIREFTFIDWPPFGKVQ